MPLVHPHADGQQDVGEPGAGGVLVELLDSSSVVVATVNTDGNGEYLFTQLPGGDYTVRVDPSGLPAGTVQTADPDGTLDDMTAQTVVLGDAITGLDFGYQPPATVTGVVFVDDNGNAVLDGAELPLPGVTVVVTDVGGVPVSVVTDGAGAYSAAVLPGIVTIDVVDATVSPDHLLTTANDPQDVVALAGAIVSGSDIGYQPVTVDLLLTKVSAEGNVQAGDEAAVAVAVRVSKSPGRSWSFTSLAIVGLKTP